MKSSVFILCSLYCVNAYRIFPLPGQNVEINNKFGNLRTIGQVTRAPEVNSRFPSFTPPSRPSFSVKSQTQTEEKITSGNVARPVSVPQSAQSMLQTKLSPTNSNQASRLDGFNGNPVTTNPVKSTFGNIARPLSTTQTVVPPTYKAVKILNRPSPNNQETTFIHKPPGFAVEPPAKDLLPPKEHSEPGLPPKVVANKVPSRPTVQAPFNDLLPPKAI